VCREENGIGQGGREEKKIVGKERNGRDKKGTNGR